MEIKAGIDPQKYEIVVVDDNPFCLNDLSRSQLLDQYNLTFFSDPNLAIQYVSSTPRVALVITDFMMPQMDGGQLTRLVHDVEPFLPIICLTMYNQLEVGKQFTQSGGVDIISKEDYPHLKQVVDTLLQPHYPFPEGTRKENLKEKMQPEAVGNDFILIKIGGSVQDQDLHRNNACLENIIRVTEELQQEGHQMIVTVGAGPLGDVIKKRLAKYGADNPSIRADFPLQIKTALEVNIALIQSLYQNNAFVFNPYSLSNLNSLTKALRERKIILAGTAPRHLTIGNDEYSTTQLLSRSDYQTLKLAEYFQQARIILVKDTPGIFDYDPLFRGNNSIEVWAGAQKDNRFYHAVTADEMINGPISRLGNDEEGDHLFETAALQEMSSRSKRFPSSVPLEVAVVCPQYSYFFPEGRNIIPHLPPTSLSDREYLKQSILTAIGEKTIGESSSPLPLVSRIRSS